MPSTLLSQRRFEGRHLGRRSRELLVGRNNLDKLLGDGLVCLAQHVAGKTERQAGGRVAKGRVGVRGLQQRRGKSVTLAPEAEHQARRSH